MILSLNPQPDYLPQIPPKINRCHLIYMGNQKLLIFLFLTILFVQETINNDIIRNYYKFQTIS